MFDQNENHAVLSEEKRVLLLINAVLNGIDDLLKKKYHLLTKIFNQNKDKIAFYKKELDQFSRVIKYLSKSERREEMLLMTCHFLYLTFSDKRYGSDYNPDIQELIAGYIISSGALQPIDTSKIDILAHSFSLANDLFHKVLRGEDWDNFNSVYREFISTETNPLEETIKKIIDFNAYFQQPLEIDKSVDTDTAPINFINLRFALMAGCSEYLDKVWNKKNKQLANRLWHYTAKQDPNTDKGRNDLQRLLFCIENINDNFLKKLILNKIFENNVLTEPSDIIVFVRRQNVEIDINKTIYKVVQKSIVTAERELERTSFSLLSGIMEHLTDSNPQTLKDCLDEGIRGTLRREAEEIRSFQETFKLPKLFKNATILMDAVLSSITDAIKHQGMGSQSNECINQFADKIFRLREAQRSDLALEVTLVLLTVTFSSRPSNLLELHFQRLFLNRVRATDVLNQPLSQDYYNQLTFECNRGNLLVNNVFKAVTGFYIENYVASFYNEKLNAKMFREIKAWIEILKSVESSTVNLNTAKDIKLKYIEYKPLKAALENACKKILVNNPNNLTAQKLLYYTQQQNPDTTRGKVNLNYLLFGLELMDNNELLKNCVFDEILHEAAIVDGNNVVNYFNEGSIDRQNTLFNLAYRLGANNLTIAFGYATRHLSDDSLSMKMSLEEAIMDEKQKVAEAQQQKRTLRIQDAKEKLRPKLLINAFLKTIEEFNKAVIVTAFTNICLIKNVGNKIQELNDLGEHTFAYTVTLLFLKKIFNKEVKDYKKYFAERCAANIIFSGALDLKNHSKFSIYNFLYNRFNDLLGNNQLIDKASKELDAIILESEKIPYFIKNPLQPSKKVGPVEPLDYDKLKLALLNGCYLYQEKYHKVNKCLWLHDKESEVRAKKILYYTIMQDPNTAEGQANLRQILFGLELTSGNSLKKSVFQEILNLGVVKDTTAIIDVNQSEFSRETAIYRLAQKTGIIKGQRPEYELSAICQNVVRHLSDSNIKNKQVNFNLVVNPKKYQCAQHPSVPLKISCNNIGARLTQVNYILSDLQSKDLYRFSPENWKIFCDLLVSSKVKYLSLMRNKLYLLPIDRWKDLCDALVKSKITLLDLRGTYLSRLSQQKWVILTEALKKSNVTDLRLGFNGLSEGKMKATNEYVNVINHSVALNLQTCLSRINQYLKIRATETSWVTTNIFNSYNGDDYYKRRCHFMLILKSLKNSDITHAIQLIDENLPLFQKGLFRKNYANCLLELKYVLIKYKDELSHILKFNQVNKKICNYYALYNSMLICKKTSLKYRKQYSLFSNNSKIRNDINIAKSKYGNTIKKMPDEVRKEFFNEKRLFDVEYKNITCFKK